MNYVVVGLGFGDESKGMTVARLTQPGDLIVKFTGGCQCAHNVRWGAQHHTFSQFGSGMVKPDTDTAIGPGFLFDPLALLREADHLVESGIDHPLRRVTIDPEALVITPVTVIAGRHRERIKRHGSTGRGIGATVRHDLDTGLGVRAKDLNEASIVRSKIRDQIRWAKQFVDLDYSDFEVDSCGLINDWPIKPVRDAMRGRRWVAEGSQGILLDQHYGWFPHVTHATTTARPMLDLLGQEQASPFATRIVPTIVGVTRTYQTRHGAGPFPTEAGHLLDGDDNTTYEWAGAFRRGFLDIELLRYAIRVQPIDRLVVTHRDFSFMPLAHGEPYATVDPLDFEARAEYTKTLFDRKFELSGRADPERISDLLGVPLLDLEDGPIVEPGAAGRPGAGAPSLCTA